MEKKNIFDNIGAYAFFAFEPENRRIVNASMPQWQYEKYLKKILTVASGIEWVEDELM